MTKVIYQPGLLRFRVQEELVQRNPTTFDGDFAEESRWKDETMFDVLAHAIDRARMLKNTYPLTNYRVVDTTEEED